MNYLQEVRSFCVIYVMGVLLFIMRQSIIIIYYAAKYFYYYYTEQLCCQKSSNTNHSFIILKPNRPNRRHCRELFITATDPICYLFTYISFFGGSGSFRKGNLYVYR